MFDVTCVGICCVDSILRPVDEFPSPGTLKMVESVTLTTGGDAVNAAVALGKMGLNVQLMTTVGDDYLGDFIIEQCLSNQVDVGAVKRLAGINTPFTVVCVNSQGERCFLHTRGSNAHATAESFDPNQACHGRVVFFAGAMLMDNMDGQPTADFLAACRARGRKTMLDGKYRANPADNYRLIKPVLPHVDYLIPSEMEAKYWAADCGSEDPACMAHFLQQQGAHEVIIKLGAAGCQIFAKGTPPQSVPAYRVEDVVDTTGAGDCWGAGFAAGISMGMSVAEAARLGAAVSAHCVTAAGATTGVPSIGDIQAFQARQDSGG